MISHMHVNLHAAFCKASTSSPTEVRYRCLEPPEGEAPPDQDRLNLHQSAAGYSSCNTLHTLPRSLARSPLH